MSSSLECVSFCSQVQSNGANLYQVYGLVVESELEMPELLPAPSQAVPDIQVCFGDVPATVEDAIVETKWCQASKRELLMNVEDIIRYYVDDGQRIVMQLNSAPGKEIRASDVRLWLLGSAFGALLHQRGMLPLHVSAVKTPSGVWAFTGQSGEGKSTLAGFLHKRFGWKLISDDVSVIDPDHSEAIMHPGPQKLKLWEDALDYLDFSDCLKVRDLSNTDKFQLYFADDSEYQPEPLRGLVLLESLLAEAQPSIERLKGGQAFNACMESIYRPPMNAWFKSPERRMHELVQLCQQVHVYRFSRPRSLENMEQNLAPLLELLVNPES